MERRVCGYGARIQVGVSSLAFLLYIVLVLLVV